MEQDVFFFGNSAYVTYKFLMDRGVPSSTIYNNTSKKIELDKRWYSESLPNNKKNKIIAYDSIPVGIVTKYKLPSYLELREIANQVRKEIKEIRKAKISSIVKVSLDLEYNNWDELKPIYENELLTDEKLEMFCKTHAVLAKIIDLNECGYKLKDLFDAYYQYDDLIFTTESYNSFCNKIKQISLSSSIEEVLIHGLKNLPSNNLKKTEDVIIEIKRLYFNGKKPNAESILKEVNDYLIRSNRKPISISSVYNVISQKDVQNESLIVRHGIKYAEDIMLPFGHFFPPSKEGILWLIDGSRFQFAYKTEQSKFNFLIYFIILDASSKRIVGYSYDSSENASMIKRAFEMACNQTKYLPREIISDNSRAYNATEFVKFKASVKLLGVNWNHTLPRSPRKNGSVERFFGVFQESFCKSYVGYIGDGIRSKYLDGKPSPEEIKKHLNDKSLRTKEELISLLNQLVLKYNNSSNRLKSIHKDLKNDELFKKESISLKKLNPITIDTLQYCKLFWPYKIEMVKHGEISFDIDSETFIYQIYDEKLLLKLHSTRVLIRYNINDLSNILVFDPQTDQYVCSLKRYRVIPKASEERSEIDNSEMYKNALKTRKLKDDLLKRVEKIYEISEKNRESLPPKLIEFGIYSKTENEEAKRIYLNEELARISEVENNKESLEIKESCQGFRDLYFRKGDLKIFNYGNN